MQILSAKGLRASRCVRWASEQKLTDPATWATASEGLQAGCLPGSPTPALLHHQPSASRQIRPSKAAPTRSTGVMQFPSPAHPWYTSLSLQPQPLLYLCTSIVIVKTSKRDMNHKHDIVPEMFVRSGCNYKSDELNHLNIST